MAVQEAEAMANRHKQEQQRAVLARQQQEIEYRKKKDKEDNKPRGFARGLNAERIIGKVLAFTLPQIFLCFFISHAVPIGALAKSLFCSIRTSLINTTAVLYSMVKC